MIKLKLSRRGVRIERGGRDVRATARRWMFVATVLLSGIFVTYAGRVVMSAQKVAGAESVWDGVYTTAQATRGKEIFSENCKDCHMEDLQGDTADVPALVGDVFLDEWMDKSLDELFTRMRSTMPQDSPQSLSTQMYLDVLAYILQSNKFPAAEVELKRDANLMKAMMITKKK